MPDPVRGPRWPWRRSWRGWPWCRWPAGHAPPGQLVRRRLTRFSTISTGWDAPHSSWALATSAGIIIIDTNFAYTTQAEIVEGLTKLGLNPRDIKYVIISHAHGDHDQGAADLQKLSGATVVMGAADWDMHACAQGVCGRHSHQGNISVGPQGHKLTLGDTTIDIIATPGHTDGTLSYVFPVRDGGRTLQVAYSGGTLTGAFGTNGARWDEYIASQKKIAAAAAAAGATVVLSNHSEYDGAYTKARLIAAPRQAGENHPFHRQRRCGAALFHRDAGMRHGVEDQQRRQVIPTRSGPPRSNWPSRYTPCGPFFAARPPRTSLRSVRASFSRRRCACQKS